MTDATYHTTGRRREDPADVRTTTYQIDGETYQVRQGLVSFMIRKQRMMTVPGKGQVPYWHTVTNRDEIVKVLRLV